MGLVERLDQAAALHQGVATPAPVVEIAGDDQRRIGGHDVIDGVAQPAQLESPVRLAQAQVHADRVQRHRAAGNLDHAMQQSAGLMALHRDIAIVLAGDRKSRQQRIAVMAFRIDRVAAVGVLRPDRVGEEFVLGFGWPVEMAAGVAGVRAQHFLQEHQVRRCGADRVAQLRQHVATIEHIEAHVGVQAEDVDCRHARKGRMRVQRAFC